MYNKDQIKQRKNKRDVLNSSLPSLVKEAIEIMTTQPDYVLFHTQEGEPITCKEYVETYQNG